MEHADNLNTTFKYEETDLIKSSSKKSHVNNLTFQVFYQFSVKYCNLFQNCISVSVVISGITFFSICQNSWRCLVTLRMVTVKLAYNKPCFKHLVDVIHKKITSRSLSTKVYKAKPLQPETTVLHLFTSKLSRGDYCPLFLGDFVWCAQNFEFWDIHQNNINILYFLC